MYGLLSHVTEKIGGKSWEDLIRDKIFNPNGMDSSSFTHQVDLTMPGLAKPYLPDDDGQYREIDMKFQR